MVAAGGPGVEGLLDELVTDAQRLLAMFEQAERHLSVGDRQAACDVVAITRHTLGYLGTGRQEILRRLHLAGIEPRTRRPSDLL
jgi:hypothetical protein